MKYIVIILSIFITSVCYGETINEKYSHKAFPYHDLSFKDRPASEFNNTVIVGSCFYQEWDWDRVDEPIEKDIFPDGMTGVVFRNCNLDNILIPSGNTVEGRPVEIIQAQNDWSDWKMEKKNGKWKAKEPKDKYRRLELGISIDPKDIPEKRMNKLIIDEGEDEN